MTAEVRAESTTREPRTLAERRDVEELVERSRKPQHRWRRPAAVIVAAGLLGAWAFAAARSLERDASVVRSPLIGNNAPPFELPALGRGPAVSSVAYEGEILIVNFWASWCVPCRAEAPELEAFARRYAAKGINLVGIVYNDENDEASAFRDEFGLTFPQAIDPGGRAAIDYGVYGVPETYVVDRRGKVMAKLIGATDAATLERVVAAVDAGETFSAKNGQYRKQPEGR